MFRATSTCCCVPPHTRHVAGRRREHQEAHRELQENAHGADRDVAGRCRPGGRAQGSRDVRRGGGLEPVQVRPTARAVSYRSCADPFSFSFQPADGPATDGHSEKLPGHQKVLGGRGRCWRSGQRHRGNAHPMRNRKGMAASCTRPGFMAPKYSLSGVSRLRIALTFTKTHHVRLKTLDSLVPFNLVVLRFNVIKSTILYDVLFCFNVPKLSIENPIYSLVDLDQVLIHFIALTYHPCVVELIHIAVVSCNYQYQTNRKLFFSL